MKRLLSILAVTALVATGANAAERERWTPEQAKTWYDAQPWLLGSNYLPANAINQLEMWQAPTFDPKRIDLELGWAEKLGMNTMRVFLHDLLWKEDPKGFSKRIDIFLAIAAKHHIKPLFVLFDSCWDPNPKLGPQHPPIPGVHNSGWVESPGTAALDDPSQEARLEAYVKGVVGKFSKDDRILGWDVWNEPDNEGGGNYQAEQSKQKFQRVAYYLPKVFAWARSANPKQPLTSGVWHDDNWDKLAGLNAVEKTQLEQSDVVTFHEYGWPESFAARANSLAIYGRPVICTEYMARGNGSTFDGDLPIAKRANIGMINWGFVQGKEQTNLPWDSWKRPYVDMQPQVWFHDILYTDGTPYRAAEAEMLKAFSAAPKGAIPSGH
jgi:Endo-beta-mannanase